MCVDAAATPVSGGSGVGFWYEMWIQFDNLACDARLQKPGEIAGIARIAVGVDKTTTTISTTNNHNNSNDDYDDDMSVVLREDVLCRSKFASLDMAFHIHSSRRFYPGCAREKIKLSGRSNARTPASSLTAAISEKWGAGPPASGGSTTSSGMLAKLFSR